MGISTIYGRIKYLHIHFLFHQPSYCISNIVTMRLLLVKHHSCFLKSTNSGSKSESDLKTVKNWSKCRIRSLIKLGIYWHFWNFWTLIWISNLCCTDPRYSYSPKDDISLTMSVTESSKVKSLSNLPFKTAFLFGLTCPNAVVASTISSSRLFRIKT